MPSFGGSVTDYLNPTPVAAAEIEPDRLTIHYSNWSIEAKYNDSITPLEMDLISTMDPPENAKHRRRH